MLNSDDMRRLAEGAKVISYGELKKARTIDDAFGEGDKLVILYHWADRSGHWIGLTRNRGEGTIDYFDSYGHGVDEPLNWPNVKKTRWAQDRAWLSRLLADSPYEIFYNEYAYQGGQTSTCGRHVGLRMRYASLPLDDYQRFCKRLAQLGDIDNLITLITGPMI